MSMILNTQVEQLHSLRYRLDEIVVLYLSTLQVAGELMLENKETVLLGKMTVWFVSSSS